MHTSVHREPALKYPPLGSHWTCPSIWHMSHLHSPVFHTASTDHTQPSLHCLWHASPHFSLLTEIPSVSLVQTASQESMASNPTSGLPYALVLRTESTGSGLRCLRFSLLRVLHTCVAFWSFLHPPGSPLPSGVQTHGETGAYSCLTTPKTEQVHGGNQRSNKWGSAQPPRHLGESPRVEGPAGLVVELHTHVPTVCDAVHGAHLSDKLWRVTEAMAGSGWTLGAGRGMGSKGLGKGNTWGVSRRGGSPLPS
jgi:hypothetical protein